VRPTLDELIEALGREPADADLSQVEASTWLRIGRERRGGWLESWLLPVRASAVAAALGAGAVLGGAHAREAAGDEEIAAFEVASALAPSTLLDQH
jgi:hypothetical protein